MSTYRKSALSATLCFGLVFGVAACHGNETPNSTAQNTSQSDQGDPAAANMAPLNGSSSTTQPASDTSYAPPASSQQYSQEEPPPPPQDQADYDQSQYAEGGYDDTADQQPVYATEPPPPLPEYEQPDAPGDDYIWTPGYWYWSPEGYYWVPGAWVLAPYVGALWTPGYWGWYGGRYR
ncbi:MAG: YXWGXW repeat-containing protein, partial [Acidobacteriaceae bacterium]